MNDRGGHSRPNEAIDFEFALTSTPDISLQRTKCREGPRTDVGSFSIIQTVAMFRPVFGVGRPCNRSRVTP